MLLIYLLGKEILMGLEAQEFKMKKVSHAGRLNSYFKVRIPKDQTLGFLDHKTFSAYRLLHFEMHKINKQKRRIPNIDTAFWLNQNDLYLNMGY